MRAEHRPAASARHGHRGAPQPVEAAAGTSLAGLPPIRAFRRFPLRRRAGFRNPGGSGLVRCCEHLSHARAGAVSFGTEAPFFSRLGMETVVLGAGYIEQAHQPDEYLPLDHIEPATAILRGLIERYCIRPVPAPLTEDASG
ncbi:M20/M25/M40 family metallo-hydrolase [Methylococcus capsulatus]|uniref:M20/M25/M40 family metallo-hydrolase n=1 Tax=Methylococcus capsulatus TaxID=414 RepID=UPI003CEDE8F5